MWVIEVINTLDPTRSTPTASTPATSTTCGAIFTAPFLHVSFAHLIDNTIPFVFMGVIIALRGAARLALVTAIVIVVGGLGTWLIAPAAPTRSAPAASSSATPPTCSRAACSTAACSRSLIGVVVGVVWGGALLVEPRAPPRGSPGRATCAARSAAWSPPGCWRGRASSGRRGPSGDRSAGRWPRSRPTGPRSQRAGRVA